jgi:hypothetical protein
MSQFALAIDIGNDAMQSAEDIADALRDVAALLYQGQTSGPIHDVNGNTVGRFTTDHWPERATDAQLSS